MKTKHEIIFQNSQNLSHIVSNSVDMIITSPPYPMIAMWDKMFCQQNPDILHALEDNDGNMAFELMHKELDLVWNEVFRVLKKGAFACINIGDTARTINGNFGLFSNHSRILQYLIHLEFTPLPDILWKKPCNAPNKFMGSGMLPAGAYATLEHEYILIVRKGGKREFKKLSEKMNRRQSAYFWEERNVYFSDIWFDIKGTSQLLPNAADRSRSGAFPFELAHRLINMYSVKSDTILDPFIGTGTTMLAAMTAARNCIGFEIDYSLKDTIYESTDNIINFSNQYISNRLKKHLTFVQERTQTKGRLKHFNKFYRFPVMTNQENELILNELIEVKNIKNNVFEVIYADEARSFEKLKLF